MNAHTAIGDSVPLEIDVEDIGTVRHLSMWQWKRVKAMAAAKRPVAILALASGLSLKQFNKLPQEQQRAIRDAYSEICCPPVR